MKNKKIIFMGTPKIAAEYLNSLIKNNIKIDVVFTQSPKKQLRGMKLTKSPVHLLANEKKIEVHHPEYFDNEIIIKLKKMENEVGFNEAISSKLTGEKIKFFNLGKDNDYKKLLGKDLIEKMNSLFKEQIKKYEY